MKSGDEVAIANRKCWNDEVASKCGYTIPWLDLTTDDLDQYARGEIESLRQRPSASLTPRQILADVAGKNVLCLSCGGGQQSAVFGLLGANVTVVDITPGQLEADQTAATHYGYDVRTIQADMRDLSCLEPKSFDIVYGMTPCYVPSVREVYAQVSCVLRPGGLYRTDMVQPGIHVAKWDGSGYRIMKPYFETEERRTDGAIEFRHYMDEIFNGLLDNGLSLLHIEDFARSRKPDPDAKPGSWRHESAYVGGCFVILAKKETPDQFIWNSR
ncbi:MAG: class I SAM-dependent methyltransferase [bacterium]|nr:class I SAM-dependent methyltransferase [bacterium]